MLRFAPYSGIIAALALGALVATLSERVISLPVSERAAPAASSTLAVFPPEPTLLAPALSESGSTADLPETPTSPTQETPAPKKSVPPPLPASPPTPSEPVPTAPPATVEPESSPAETNAALDASAAALRGALVNIICYVPSGSGLHSISGSGVFVDSKGIILTNAHIAQYFLLRDRGVSCRIRSGSPATDSYEAALVFISSAWISSNASILTQESPIGTGEHDFALLAVTGSASRNALPSSFPSIPLATSPPPAGTPVVIASYGAQFLETSQVQSSLFPTIVFGSVKDVFTFAANTVDVLALGGSAAAQEGSSGGGVAAASGELVGTITTSTVEGPTDTRSLDAITASYIRSAYANETGEALDILLSRPIDTAVNGFAQKIPALEALLTANLP